MGCQELGVSLRAKEQQFGPFWGFFSSAGFKRSTVGNISQKEGVN